MKFLVNKTSTDSSYAVAPANFVEVASNDYFIFTNGSTDVEEGDPIPTAEQLNQAAEVIPVAGQELISKIFLADVSENELVEVHLAGEQNKRYVFCVSFDDITATEPLFELWDTSSYTTYNLQILGSGTANNSLIKGIVTTDALPGPGWTGKPLAGDADANRLLLNNGGGKLLAAKDLYFNLKAYIKSTFTAAVEAPKFLIKYYYVP